MINAKGTHLQKINVKFHTLRLKVFERNEISYSYDISFNSKFDSRLVD